MDITKQLELAGLRDNEIRTYLYLLSEGIATPPQIARATKIARPNCYKLLQSLKERGLITEQEKGKRKAYIPSDPAALVSSMQEKTDAMSRLLPDLRALFASQTNKPSIKFFDGAEQVKQLFDEMLGAKEVCGVASINKLSEIFGATYLTSLIKQMQKRGIKLRDIITKDSEKAAIVPTKSPRELYEYRTLPESSGDIPVDILTWDDKIAFISIDKPVFGTLIQNKAMASMIKIMFELSWKQLSK